MKQMVNFGAPTKETKPLGDVDSVFFRYKGGNDSIFYARRWGNWIVPHPVRADGTIESATDLTTIDIEPLTDIECLDQIDLGISEVRWE